MGAGKSTLGAAVAERLGLPFVDADDEIERRVGRISEFFDRYGETGFRELERTTVEALAVVAEAAVAFELARAAREKFGGDAVGDFVAAHRAYLERIGWRTR